MAKIVDGKENEFVLSPLERMKVQAAWTRVCQMPADVQLDRNIRVILTVNKSRTTATISFVPEFIRHGRGRKAGKPARVHLKIDEIEQL